MIMLSLFGLLSSFAFSNEAQAQSPFSGAWWVVNSPVVSVLSEGPNNTVIDTDCDAEKYFAEQVCDKKNESIYYYTKKGDGLCSIATEKLPICWYYLYQPTNNKNVLYIKADPNNTRPGLGYALTSKRLIPGEWPMK